MIAAGTFQRPHVPSAARTLAGGMAQLHSSDYRNPDTLPDGGVLVVGSGQSGCQIAQELHEHGRRVALSTSAVGRLPRRYRGRDGMDWAVALGMIDESVDDLDSLDERFAPNPQISGRDGGRDINLHAFARDGITLLGHLDDIQDRRVSLRADLHDNLAVGDTMAAQFRTGVDTFVEKAGLDAPGDVVPELTDGFQQDIITELDLAAEGITTVIWATGYRWDYSWIDLPIFDDHGYPMQRRGVVAEYPGLYFVGLSWLHTRKSGLFLGVGDDAAHVVDHLVG